MRPAPATTTPQRDAWRARPRRGASSPTRASPATPARPRPRRRHLGRQPRSRRTPRPAAPRRRGAGRRRRRRRRAFCESPPRPRSPCRGPRRRKAMTVRPRRRRAPAATTPCRGRRASPTPPRAPRRSRRARRDQQEHGALPRLVIPLCAARDAGHVHGRRGPAHEQGRRRAVGRRRQAVGAALDEGVRVDVRRALRSRRRRAAPGRPGRRSPARPRAAPRGPSRRPAPPEQVRGELEREDRRAVLLHEGLDAVELEVARAVAMGLGKDGVNVVSEDPPGAARGKPGPA